MGLAWMAPAAWNSLEFPGLSIPLYQQSWDQIRLQFPLEKDRIYLNNGTFGPSPFPVLKAVQDSFDKTNRTGNYGNPGSGREKIAEFFGVKSTEISLTHNTTEGINIMAQGLPFQAGDEVIVTTHEHAGNAIPWLNRMSLDGIVLRVFEPKDTQEENFKAIKNLVSSRTKAIAIPHVTCTTGTVFPIRQISEFARKKRDLDGHRWRSWCRYF